MFLLAVPMLEGNDMGSRVTEIIMGVLACYVGYFVVYKKEWDFVHDQPVPKFSGLILIVFGVIVIVYSSFKIIKQYFNDKRQKRP